MFAFPSILYALSNTKGAKESLQRKIQYHRRLHSEPHLPVTVGDGLSGSRGTATSHPNAGTYTVTPQDNIELDPSVWTDVRRWKWNADKPMEFSDAEDLGWPRNHIKKIHPGEKVQEFADRDMWSESWNIADWKAFLKVNLPDFNGEWIEEMTKLWSVLEEKMGGPDVKRKVIWPVVCVIATRKSDRSASFWA